MGTEIGLILDWENGICVNGTGMKAGGNAKNVEYDWEMLFLGHFSVQQKAVPYEIQGA